MRTTRAVGGDRRAGGGSRGPKASSAADKPVPGEEAGLSFPRLTGGGDRETKGDKAAGVPDTGGLSGAITEVVVSSEDKKSPRALARGERDYQFVRIAGRFEQPSYQPTSVPAA